MRLARKAVSAVILRSLRSSFRRVVWVGGRPQLPPNVPVVLYANHHYFHDGYLLWLLTSSLLRRPGLLWMEDWDRFPLFATWGVLPFPPNDPARRTMTIRRTVRLLRNRPDHLFVYFPEGKLHAPDEGVAAFDSEVLHRLARLIPQALWYPVGIRLTWWAESQPTALLAGGPLHDSPNGSERERLLDVLERLHAPPREDVHVLMEGHRSPQERWNLKWLTSLFGTSSGS